MQARQSRLALTSTCTASDVQPRARTRTAMVASAAFMVTADGTVRVAVCLLFLAVDVLSRCSAQCDLPYRPQAAF